MLKDHNTVKLVRLEPATPRSRVKHTTTEPLRSLHKGLDICVNNSTGRQFTQKIDDMLDFEAVHEISNNVVCATSKASDQPTNTHSLIRAFARRLNIL